MACGVADFDPNPPIGDFDRFDPVADSWSSLPDATARWDAQHFSVGGCGYIAGGCDNSYRVVKPNMIATVRKYDLVSESWGYVQPMLTAQSMACGMTLGDVGIVAGGTGEVKQDTDDTKVTYGGFPDDEYWATRVCKKYQPSTDTWSLIKKIQFATLTFHYPAAGGYQLGYGPYPPFLRHLERYNLAGDTWWAGSTLPYLAPDQVKGVVM